MRQFFGLIFHGAGEVSAIQQRGLLKRVEEGCILSSGMQQGPCDESDSEELRDVVRDVAAAFGYEIDFTGKTLYPPNPSNMGLDNYSPLEQTLIQIKDNGLTIARCSAESKKLRAEVAKIVTASGLGEVNDKTPIEFMLANEPEVVSVIKAKESNDITITFKSLKVLQ